MSRNRTLWGSLLALLIVIGFATPAFAQDAIDDAVAAVEDIQNEDTQEPQTESDDLVVAAQYDVPSPVMALDSHEGEEKAWYDRIMFSGSFRFRQQWNYSSGGAGGGNTYPGGGFNIYRMRYRLLLNLKTDLSDDVHVGIQLGTTATATSANFSYSNFTAAGVNVRKAWGTIEFADDMLRITFGQFGIPKTMYRSILTFDSDVAITGIHVAVAVMEEKDDKKKITQALYVNGLILYTNNSGNNGDDPIMLAGTVDFRIMGLQVGAGFWHITHQDVIAGQFNLKSFGGPNFAAIEFYAKYDLGALKVFAHLIYNTGGRRGFGALGGVSFQDGKGEGAIKADLIYYFQETRAWPGGLSDADAGPGSGVGSSFGGLSGASGIELNAKYYITANVALGIESNFYYLVEDETAGADDNDFAMTLIFDAYFEF